MRHCALLLAGWLTACAQLSGLVAEKPPPPLPLPPPTPTLDLTLRVFVIGDAGLANYTHDAAFNAMKSLISRNSVPSVLLVPGDVLYPDGPPDPCGESLKRIQDEYLKPVPANVPI